MLNFIRASARAGILLLLTLSCTNNTPTGPLPIPSTVRGNESARIGQPANHIRFAYRRTVSRRCRVFLGGHGDYKTGFGETFRNLAPCLSINFGY